MAPSFVMCARSVLLVAVLAVASVDLATADSDIILSPSKTSGGPAAALVFIQGASITTTAYLPLITAITDAYSAPLWVAVPAYPDDIPDPLVLGSGIARVLKSLQEAGMPSDTPVFYAGHSMGGAMIQGYVNTSAPTSQGQILMGAYLTHTYDNVTYPVPTLTVGGELDGLCRCTRVAENWYRYIEQATQPAAATTRFPVVIIPGMTHMQFASGKPPELVYLRDLKPEITITAAHQAVADVFSAFLGVRMGVAVAAGTATLQASVNRTGVFSRPIIASLLLEGYWQFLPPCFKVKGGAPCIPGSPWLNTQAQAVMSGLPDGAVVVNTDQFFSVSEFYPKDPLPNITTRCKAPSPSCSLASTTVTQLTYNVLTPMDTGFVPISARQMECKLNSRQRSLLDAGVPSVNFNVSDGGNRCADVNTAAIQYAAAHAGAATAARFAKLGQAMVVGKDTEVIIFPIWSSEDLKFTTTTTTTGGGGRAQLTVSSPAMKYSVDMPIIGGLHFCKLLSPARAMEWMYVDGLRYYDSLDNSTAVAPWL